MTRKPFALAAVATATALFLIPTQAAAADPALGAIIGGTFGAAVGHGINGRNGAIVGGVLGALTGASIAAGPAYAPVGYPYGPSVSYYDPQPVYYAPPPVVYRAAPVIVRPAVPRLPVYAPIVVARPHGWHAAHHHYRDGYGWR